MLINFREAVKKYGMTINGVIVGGAHFGEEMDDYLSIDTVKGIVLFEPCKAAFGVLKENFSHLSNVFMHNVALGSEEGIMTMYTETRNEGQSNSLLKPAKHLEQHPTIIFNGTEDVQVHRLDSYGYSYNLLVLDCQGFELEILKGATKTLKHVDYIYCEVNRDFVYENCAQVHEIDLLLSEEGFRGVKTKWVGNWGDKIYIRKKLL